MLPFHQVVADDFAAVDALINRELHSEVSLVEDIGHYLVEAGGKRLRPLLVLLTARTFAAAGPDQVALAAIIEFIHTATLLHDDVVDTSSLRRGRPTANAAFGNAPSVLVGDFLYSRAFQMLVGLGSMEVLRLMADATNVISEGEVEQLVNASDPNLSEAKYLAVIRKKTAVLFAAACETSAVLAGAPAAGREAVTRFGLHLGLAFQLMDDVLDYEGDSAALGKQVGDDLAEGKPTLPFIQALKCADADTRRALAQALASGGRSQLSEVIRMVQASGAVAYTRARAEAEVAEALAALEHLPAGPYRDTMADLAHFAIQRNH